MAQTSTRQLDKGREGAPPPTHKSSLKKRARQAVVLPPGLLTTLQSRQLINSMRLRPAERGSGGARPATSGGGGRSADGPKSAPAACLGGACRAYVPVRTLPLIFAQRKRHLQQQKSKAQHAAPYQRRSGEGLLALPEDVLLKVVCLLSHDELKPLFQVCKALRTTLRNAVAYHFNYNTPSRPTEDAAPPALGERQRRPARTNAIQVISRLSRGARAASGRGASGGSQRSTAPRALDFADATPEPPRTAVASQA